MLSLYMKRLRKAMIRRKRMEDSGIIELYLGRDESAIAQTQQKYGKQC